MTYQQALTRMAGGGLVSIHGLTLGYAVNVDGSIAIDEPILLYIGGQSTDTAYAPYPGDKESSDWGVA